MAFHIDILTIIGEDGKEDLVEIDYTIDQCIEKGWLSKDGIWIRKEIDIKAICSKGERPRGPDKVPDTCYGMDHDLKLVKVKGKWVADMGKGLLFK